jgi:hypothetical protein
LVAGVAAAVVVVAGVIALVIGLGGDGGNAAGGSDTPSGPYIRTGQQYPTTGTYTASGPWRIRLVDEIEHNNNGCDLTVSSSDTDLVVPPLQGAYELTTVQIPRAGHFQWRVNDAECQVAPAVGSGNLPLPAVVPASKGDSDAFAVSGPVTVEVKDFQGSETCRLRLVDATDGTLLDVADAKDYKATLRMDSGGAHTAYLGLDSCTVRISSG